MWCSWTDMGLSGVRKGNLEFFDSILGGWDILFSHLNSIVIFSLSSLSQVYQDLQHRRGAQCEEQDQTSNLLFISMCAKESRTSSIPQYAGETGWFGLGITYISLATTCLTLSSHQWRKSTVTTSLLEKQERGTLSTLWTWYNMGWRSNCHVYTNSINFLL